MSIGGSGRRYRRSSSAARLTERTVKPKRRGLLNEDCPNECQRYRGRQCSADRDNQVVEVDQILSSPLTVDSTDRECSLRLDDGANTTLIVQASNSVLAVAKSQVAAWIELASADHPIPF